MNVLFVLQFLNCTENEKEASQGTVQPTDETLINPADSFESSRAYMNPLRLNFDIYSSKNCQFVHEDMEKTSDSKKPDLIVTERNQKYILYKLVLGGRFIKEVNYIGDDKKHKSIVRFIHFLAYLMNEYTNSVDLFISQIIMTNYKRPIVEKIRDLKAKIKNYYLNRMIHLVKMGEKPEKLEESKKNFFSSKNVGMELFFEKITEGLPEAHKSILFLAIKIFLDVNSLFKPIFRYIFEQNVLDKDENVEMNRKIIEAVDILTEELHKRLKSEDLILHVKVLVEEFEKQYREHDIYRVDTLEKFIRKFSKQFLQILNEQIKKIQVEQSAIDDEFKNQILASFLDEIYEKTQEKFRLQMHLIYHSPQFIRPPEDEDIFRLKMQYLFGKLYNQIFANLQEKDEKHAENNKEELKDKKLLLIAEKMDKFLWGSCYDRKAMINRDLPTEMKEKAKTAGRIDFMTGLIENGKANRLSDRFNC